MLFVSSIGAQLTVHRYNWGPDSCNELLPGIPSFLCDNFWRQGIPPAEKKNSHMYQQHQIMWYKQELMG